jgi:hypothetical protein
MGTYMRRLFAGLIGLAFRRGLRVYGRKPLQHIWRLNGDTWEQVRMYTLRVGDKMRAEEMEDSEFVVLAKPTFDREIGFWRVEVKPDWYS